MDIHPYLTSWSVLESICCKHLKGDNWQFTFSNGSQLACDVVSFHGTAVIEDLIKERVDHRKGWTITLSFDRDAETFTAYVGLPDEQSIAGQSSLNPSIAMLSAYLLALQQPLRT